MIQPPVDILVRIEQLLSAGKQQEARLLLREYLKLNPASARAWWLMSLTLTDINQQMDCLQRVLHLDPENEPARERLANLISQPPISPSVSPFTDPHAAETEKTTGDITFEPAWAAPRSTVPQQPEAKQTVHPVPPAPVDPAGVAPHPRKVKKKWGMLNILMIVFAICVIASIAGFLWLQRKAQAQAHSLQETFAVAQTLTSLPLPTLIPTWTASPTSTALPTTTFTRTPTLIPTSQYTLTRTPRPSSLIGPLVGLYAPDFSLTNLATGQRVTLGQFDGQPVLLFFWATWCTQCNNEVGSIETISQNYKDAGLVVLSINAAEDYATLTIYRNVHLLTFPILLDPDSVVLSAYHVNGDTIPKHFFVNSSGRIAFIGKGEMTLDELKIQVDAILRRYPTSTP
jgi:cytochrome c biogenesis protein CcmG/thiol:disulfide interchange protein DsbE